MPYLNCPGSRLTVYVPPGQVSRKLSAVLGTTRGRPHALSARGTVGAGQTGFGAPVGARRRISARRALIAAATYIALFPRAAGHGRIASSKRRRNGLKAAASGSRAWSGRGWIWRRR
jgi:hypothetical protein